MTDASVVQDTNYRPTTAQSLAGQSVLINYPKSIRDSLTTPAGNLQFMQGMAKGFEDRGMIVTWFNFEPGEFQGIPGDHADYIVQYHERFDTILPRRYSCKVGPIKQFFWVDPLGYAKYASQTGAHFDASAIDAKEAIAFTERLKSAMVTSNDSKYAQPAPIDIPSSSSLTLFLPMQVTGDSVLAGEMSPLEHLHFVVNGFMKVDPTVRLLVKIHPKCGFDEVRAACTTLHRKGHIEVVDASVHSLIAASSGTCCINSGVGIETALHGRHVFTSGRADYEAAVSGTLKTEADFEQALATLRSPVQRTKQARFLFNFFNRVLVSDQSISEAIGRVVQ